MGVWHSQPSYYEHLVRKYARDTVAINNLQVALLTEAIAQNEVKGAWKCLPFVV